MSFLLGIWFLVAVLPASIVGFGFINYGGYLKGFGTTLGLITAFLIGLVLLVAFLQWMVRFIGVNPSYPMRDPMWLEKEKRNTTKLSKVKEK